LYTPTERGFERKLGERMRWLAERKREIVQKQQIEQKKEQKKELET